MLDPYRAKRKSNGMWVYGYELQDIIGTYIVERSKPLFFNSQRFVGNYAEVRPKTVQKNTERQDIDMDDIYEGDIIQSVLNPNVYYVVKYGEHRAYCPGDEAWMTNMGFYAENHLGQFPIGPTEKWAKIAGNITDNPELSRLL